MAGERYGIEANPPREKPRVRRAGKVIVNNEGEFAAPVSISGSSPSLLGEPTSYEMSDELAPDMSEDFVFDDDPAWKQPIAMTATPRKTPSTPPPQKPAQKRSRISSNVGDKPTRRDRDKEPRGWHTYLYVVMITVSVLGMCLVGVMMMPQVAGYFWKDFDNFAFINGELLRYERSAMENYKQYRGYMDRDVIYPGIFVDGVHVGDMTIEEARAALSAAGSDIPNAFSVTVAIGDKTWTVDTTNVPAQRNLGNVLERAYAIGRTNTTEIQSTMQTPFRERTNAALMLRENGVNLTTTASYDSEAVRKIVQDIAAFVTREPVDAQILSFDYDARSFAFSDEQLGVTLDQELLFEKLTSALNRWERGVTVTVDPVVIQPKVTKADLTANFKLISAYTTDTTKEANRNNNIELACRAIYGITLLPGETFSFNQATGQRTTAKGYQSAGAIAAGQSIEEVGGGICQVSSTLFNAVARADLDIVERSPHAWPSTYVNRGEDATVNWPNLDFKFKNNRSSPVFVVAYYKDRKMTAELWGMSLGEGVSIDLESKVIKTLEPTTEIKYVNNPELAYGTSKTIVKPRTGYVVETYQIWYQNGQETKRELLHTSTYKAYQQVVEYN